MLSGTMRLIREDREHVRQVPDAREQEEEHGDALGRFAPVVEQDLRHARPEIENCAQVAEDLAPEGEGELLAVGLGWLRAPLRTVADIPPQDAGRADH